MFYKRLTTLTIGAGIFLMFSLAYATTDTVKLEENIKKAEALLLMATSTQIGSVASTANEDNNKIKVNEKKQDEDLGITYLKDTITSITDIIAGGEDEDNQLSALKETKEDNSTEDNDLEIPVTKNDELSKPDYDNYAEKSIEAVEESERTLVEECILRPKDPVCGNGVVEDGESCDDGNDLTGDGCDSACSIEEEDVVIIPDELPTDDYGEIPICGNSVVEEGEMCDDGNTIKGDGCSATCGYEYTVLKEVEQEWQICANMSNEQYRRIIERKKAQKEKERIMREKEQREKQEEVKEAEAPDKSQDVQDDDTIISDERASESKEEVEQ